MKIFLSIVLIHFFIIVPFAEEKLDSVSISYREIITTEDHFSISLPNNWIEIPSDTIKTLILHLKESYPKLEIPNYKYGFQPDSLDSWFDLPYILVKVNTDVKISLENIYKIKNLKDVADTLQKRFDIENPELKLLSNDIRYDEIFFDDRELIIWTKYSSTWEGEGSINNLTAAYLTEIGVIQFLYYSKENTFKTHELIFREILNSVQLDDDIIYKTDTILNTSKSVNKKSFKIPYFTLLILIIFIFSYLWSKKIITKK